MIDGDTVQVRFEGRRHLVSMVGIDTPEVIPAECRGKKARAFAAHKLPQGVRVVLVSDPSQGNRNDDGHLLRYVQRPGTVDLDQPDIGLAQVRNGWATLRLEGQVRFRRYENYHQEKKRAKVRDRGVWRLCDGDFHQPL